HAGFTEPSMVDTLQIHLQYLAHSLLRRPWAYWTLRDAYRLLSRTGWVIGTFEKGELDGSFTDGLQSKMAGSLRSRLRAKPRDTEAVIAKRRTIQARYQAELEELGPKHVKPGNGSDPVLLRYPLLTKDKSR